MYIQGSGSTTTTSRLRPSLQVRLQGRIPTWKADQVRPRSPDRSTGKPARNISAAWACITMASTCGSPLTSRAGTPWRPARRTMWSASGSRAAKHGLRFAVSEHLAQLQLVLGFAHRATRPAPGRRALRRRRSRLRRPVPRFPEGLQLRQLPEAMNPTRPTPGSCTTSSASRTWSITTSPTCSTPMAASPTRNTAYLVANYYNVSAKLPRRPRAKPSTPARRRATAQTGHLHSGPRARRRQRHPADPWQTDTCIGEWHYNRRDVQDAENGHRHAGAISSAATAT